MGESSDHPAVRIDREKRAAASRTRSQIGGDHYGRHDIQPLDVGYAWDLSGALYSTVKYICRHRSKGNPVGDLKKACHFIALELEKRHGLTGAADRVAQALKGESE